jgi:hypothetical protein
MKARRCMISKCTLCGRVKPTQVLDNGYNVICKTCDKKLGYPSIYSNVA